LKSLLDEATKPVIYVNLKGASVDKKLRDTFVEAMSELPYEFLWNWELQLPGKPKNVVIRKKLPQQDILGESTRWYHRKDSNVFLQHTEMLELLLLKEISSTSMKPSLLEYH
jgi:hypothetical protein